MVKFRWADCFAIPSSLPRCAFGEVKRNEEIKKYDQDPLLATGSAIAKKKALIVPEDSTQMQ